MIELGNGYFIRPISEEDNPYIENIILNVLKEYGAEGEGYAGSDPETKSMYNAYKGERSFYYVITKEDKVLGGGGISPLRGGDETICEFQKMYFLKEVRGKGLGKALLNICLEQAKKLGFKKCYIETTQQMDEAQGLYLKVGFRPIEKSMGSTGHFKIDRFYLKDFENDGE
ncbi:GNAT family N-acetyltransferase [Xanthovirga aplysinae]|uniref:GNAT family N-acetyltransferase n=1 Tax=Xanthovirga aplysinae TaxID=2529853 RepID=UPI0016575AEF|nr:GNAT family N-acetyltransferase [Xanthovirga aplysinae]